MPFGCDRILLAWGKYGRSLLTSALSLLTSPDTAMVSGAIALAQAYGVGAGGSS
ncbi:hypothetical protein [Limnothrix sp. PR1529]|uniref:hypothetical protein n=1 Tax=Limnothrix sp. PR1529 TaxID=1704291 RepID=UPI0013046B96|nr:hypothetical protein [Limnothrix sp. PR1529]